MYQKVKYSMAEKDNKESSGKNDIKVLRNIYTKYDSGQINDKEFKGAIQRVKN